MDENPGFKLKENSHAENKSNRWAWFSGKICFVQFMSPFVVCAPDHTPSANPHDPKRGPIMTLGIKARVTANGSIVLLEAALDGQAPEFIWTIGLHEGDIQAMSVVEKKIIA